MRTSTTTYSLSNSYPTHFIDAEFQSEKSTSQLADLYQRHDDEPDFDCEFLKGISHDHSENIIDLEPEEDHTDDYNDNQWDADIYDPYLESTYY
ncbi:MULTISPECIES: hypothetical protein [Flavobacterium]|uniref:hypothetical protein n=1 Tax=Flavobacterium TaxID=237 RepID=UPI0011839651|nr:MULTISPECIES: hypothetical protein [Flavobacterium]MCR4033793.1 hypothetical protein [Flavobacterium panacis]